MQKKDRSRVRPRVTATSCSRFALVLLASGGPWYLTRDRFGQFFPKTAIAMANIRYPERRCTLKKIRASAPPRKRVIPRDTRRATRRGGGRAYKDIPDCVPQAPLHHVLLVDCFSARLGVWVGFITLWRVVGRGRMRIYVTVMRNIFAVLSLSICCILLCSRGLLVLIWSRIEKSDFSSYCWLFFVVG